MSAIGWSESAPANSDKLGLGAGEIRSLKTALRTGLDAEHVWPSSGGDAGVHRLGSARAYVGAESTVSSSGTDGRLMVASNTSRLFHVGSGGTMLLGGSAVALVGTGAGATDALGVSALPQTHYMAMDATFGTLGSLGTAIVTFANSGYSGIPFTMVCYTGIPTSGTPISLSVVNGGKTTCTIYGVTSAGSAPNNTPFRLLSIGSRVLG